MASPLYVRTHYVVVKRSLHAFPMCTRSFTNPPSPSAAVAKREERGEGDFLWKKRKRGGETENARGWRIEAVSRTGLYYTSSYVVLYNFPASPSRTPPPCMCSSNGIGKFDTCTTTDREVPRVATGFVHASQQQQHERNLMIGLHKDSRECQKLVHKNRKGFGIPSAAMSAAKLLFRPSFPLPFGGRSLLGGI